MVDAGKMHRWPLFMALTAVSALRCVVAEQCISKGTAGPMIITASCTDPLFNTPIIALEADRFDPVPHRLVSGHWNGTSVDFNIYLPLKNQWENRFFQSVYPTQNSTALPEVIAFGAASGAYTVQVAGQLGYRADAATAKFAKTVAREYYDDTGSSRIYGYIYGGSGGSYQTIGAAENTHGVWDGASAIVQAIPGSVPLNLCARALGNLILRKNAIQIEAALRPGGSGDPFLELGQAGRAVLKEVTNLGVPLQAWEDFLEPANSENTLAIFEPAIKEADPTYADDFWTKPGYLGNDPSELGSLFRAALVDIFATIERVEYDSENLPTTLFLDKIPSELTAGFEFTLYDDTGKMAIGNLGGVLSSEDNSLALSPVSNTTIARAISQGRKVRIDNRWHLSVLSYHRHQLPTRSGFYGF
ncbi:unnamed protein product [Clonostachys byssicola]|uniref:Uncharacterized protein n=1 Tax=Clonostachys byssicola TaxID=160290 RepID=A0A9N9YBV8_9HYPO|nr:unnamed protein product [Clonostachys byssicola]